MTLRIVAVALVTQAELDRLGTAFRRSYPIEDGPCFAGYSRRSTKRIGNSGESVIASNKVRLHLPVGSKSARPADESSTDWKMPESASGRHFWRVVTTKEDAERNKDRFICKKCRKEVVE